MSVKNDRTEARLFFALWPDEATRSRLTEAGNEARSAAAGKWVKPCNLHVTLAFLGDVEAKRWSELGRIAAETLEPSFILVLDRLEIWPRNGIVCLVPSQTPLSLENLAASLAQRLEAAEFPTESRPFRAHLTLARRGRSERTSLPLSKPVVWNINAFSLMESRLGREGSIYIQRETWPLQETGQ